MKQTFAQYIKSKDIDKPITREQVADALIQIAKYLKLPEQPDPNQEMWFLNAGAVFEIEGDGGRHEGRIRLTFRTPLKGA